MTLSHSTQPNIITLHDAITDSPVYRTSAIHFDQQLDSFLQWINDLSQQTKAYAEKLKQLNAETIALAAKVNPTSMVNNQFLDFKIVDIAANNFGDALKTNLTFKRKMVSDLEGKFTGPIEKFVDERIRPFKDFRKQHEHTLVEYESALANYAALNKNDDTTIIQATTQRLCSARKKYVEMSSEHIARIAKLRHDLEHILVEQYSTTISSRKDFYNDAQVWKQLNTMLFSWADWLTEDKRTYDTETHKQQLAQQILEREYLDTIQLKHGMATKIKTNSTAHSTKSGYLMTKSTQSTASSWERQWCFVHDGYFGSCKVSSSEATANITLDYYVPLQLCQIKSLVSSDRRFCFELTLNQHPQTPLFMLQAENEQDLQDWISAMALNSTDIPTTNFDTSMRNRPTSLTIDNHYDPNNDFSQARSPASLITKSKSTTVVSTPTDVPVTLSTNSDLSIASSSPGNIMVSNLSGSPPPLSALPSPITFKITSLDRQDNMHLLSAPSLTPLLLHKITNGLQQQQQPSGTVLNNNSFDSTRTWGTPWAIIPPSQRSAPQRTGLNHGENYKSLHGKIVWPISQDSLLQSLVVPDLPGYTEHLKDKNQELRALFNGVSPQEAVLDVLTASFLKKQNDMTTLDHQSGVKELKQSSSISNYYGGNIYITQDTFWFYSCLSYNCITTIALKLNTIEDIQVTQDTELIIELAKNDSDDTPTSPLVFSVILDDAESVADKLRFLMYNAKLADPMQLRNVYRKILAMSSTPSESPSPTPSISTLDSLADDPPYASNQQNDNPQQILSTRMTSSNTTTTIDTTTTLVTPQTISNHPTPSIKPKKKIVSKPFVDPDSLPDHLTKPSGPLACNCDDHLDRRDAEMELPISAKRLYELMFSDEATAPPTNGGVWNRKTEGIDGHDLRVSRWEPIASSDEQNGQMKRILKYWMPVANPVVRMKEAEVVETQILLKKEDYLCYVVQISTKTEALPFADAFIPSVRYCITYMDDSRCKLTCHLGVRWTKWVMAKIIVTKAALAGMSDSVNIFVPILKEAANSIQISVENIRQSAKQTISEYEDGSDDNDDGICEVDGSNETDENKALETTATPAKSTVTVTHEQRKLDVRATNDLLSQHTNPTISPNSKQMPPPTADPALARTESLTKSIASTTTTSKALPNSTIKTAATKTHHQLVKEKLTDASGQEAPSLVTAALDSIWPPGTWTLAILAIGCLLYSVWISTSLNCTMDHQEPLIHPQVVSHAVYLRDLEDGFIKKSLRPPYAGSQCYTFFLHTRQDEQEYTWYDPQHYRLALEYRSSREKLGIQRHNIITTLQALNTADTELLETEYLNWLLDNRQRCRGDQQRQDQLPSLESNDTISNMCDQITTQIGTHF